MIHGKPRKLKWRILWASRVCSTLRRASASRGSSSSSTSILRVGPRGASSEAKEDELAVSVRFG